MLVDIEMRLRGTCRCLLGAVREDDIGQRRREGLLPDLRSIMATRELPGLPPARPDDEAPYKIGDVSLVRRRPRP